MILSHDRERGRVSLSTKKLEPTPGDMIRNPKLVFEKVFSLLARVIFFCHFCNETMVVSFVICPYACTPEHALVFQPHCYHNDMCD